MKYIYHTKTSADHAYGHSQVNCVKMLNFKRLLRVSNSCVAKQKLRMRSTSAELRNGEVTARERQWRQAKERYVTHSHIVYSSYLESKDKDLNLRRLPPQQQIFNYSSHQENKAPLSLPQFPDNWMEEYEFYEGAIDEEGNINSKHGTADATIRPSCMPCGGCGAHLHCASAALPGFIPKEIFNGRSNTELRRIICKRCHFLKHYNIALDVEVTPESYVETISSIRNEFALVILIVDLLDMPCSIWPGMQELLGRKRPVLVVGNKVDLLPRDSNRYLERVKACLRQQILQSGFDALNIKYFSLISAKTGYGVEELITQLHKIWRYKGNVFLTGCTNVGKSTLFNILLNSDYCRTEASDLVHKATMCPWPGTTLQMLRFPILRPSELRLYQRFRRLFSERAQKAAEEKLSFDKARKTGSIEAAKLKGRVGRTFLDREEINDAFTMSIGTQPIITLNETPYENRGAKWCYDTPGVMHPDQITNLLTTAELLQLQPNEMIKPRSVRLSKGMSMFLAGLGRVDLLDSGDQMAAKWIRLFIFSSLGLPITIAPTEHADEVYRKYLGSPLLGVPIDSEAERLNRWPGLHSQETFNIMGSDNTDGYRDDCEEALTCDIVLSSAGWIGVHVPNNVECTFRAWTPYARGIYIRTPPLIPHAKRLVGKRIRNSLAYNLSKPFVFRK